MLASFWPGRSPGKIEVHLPGTRRRVVVDACQDRHFDCGAAGVGDEAKGEDEPKEAKRCVHGFVTSRIASRTFSFLTPFRFTSCTARKASS